MKLVVLKPIMWNDQRYVRPAGYQSTSGYSRDYGYGHEEWNNNPDWVWRGFKVFHTEGKPSLVHAASTGDLGLVMIAAHDRRTYAVGIATSVFANDEEDRKLIADNLNVVAEASTVLVLPTVRAAFSDDRAKFMAHWKRQYTWIRWKCPPNHYYWFPKPIPLDARKITGKTKLSLHHGTYTLTTPEVVLEIIAPYVPTNRKAILQWLSFGDFERPKRVGTVQPRGERRRTKLQRRYGNAPTDRRFQYWVEGNRAVEPLHYRLQEKFVKFLTGRSIEYVENENHIDVQYHSEGKKVFCEVKPTENIETHYAIRAAIGQLLEYRFRRDPTARLEIVLGKKPKHEEVEFVKSVGMTVTYFDRGQRIFVVG